MYIRQSGINHTNVSIDLSSEEIDNMCKYKLETFLAIVVEYTVMFGLAPHDLQ